MESLPTRFILVMRHAEKPDSEGNPNLSKAGYARADGLATYIPEKFGDPDVIIAAKNSPASERPVQTVTPLAQRHDPPLTVQTPYTDRELLEAAALMLTGADYRDKQLIVCCWHHENIPPLMNALKCEPGSYPDLWHGKVFNLILKVRIVGPEGPNPVEQIVEPF